MKWAPACRIVVCSLQSWKAAHNNGSALFLDWALFGKRAVAMLGIWIASIIHTGFVLLLDSHN